MRRAAPFLLFSALMCMVAGSADARDTPSVLVVKVDGSIDRTLASYLVDSIEDAEREGSTLVLQLDSAGTLDQEAVPLAERIHDASVPVIVWVGPAPAKAEGEVTLQTKIATSEAEQRVTVRFTDLGPLDRALHAAASPTWIYVLLVLGLAALAFEATQPGFGFAGFGGLRMLALAVYGLTVVPFSPLGLGLLLGGI